MSIRVIGGPPSDFRSMRRDVFKELTDLLDPGRSSAQSRPRTQILRYVLSIWPRVEDFV